MCVCCEWLTLLGIANGDTPPKRHNHAIFCMCADFVVRVQDSKDQSLSYCNVSRIWLGQREILLFITRSCINGCITNKIWHGHLMWCIVNSQDCKNWIDITLIYTRLIAIILLYKHHLNWAFVCVLLDNCGYNCSMIICMIECLVFHSLCCILITNIIDIVNWYVSNHFFPIKHSNFFNF